MGLWYVAAIEWKGKRIPNVKTDSSGPYVDGEDDEEDNEQDSHQAAGAAAGSGAEMPAVEQQKVVGRGEQTCH